MTDYNIIRLLCDNNSDDLTLTETTEMYVPTDEEWQFKRQTTSKYGNLTLTITRNDDLDRTLRTLTGENGEELGHAIYSCGTLQRVGFKDSCGKHNYNNYDGEGNLSSIVSVSAGAFIEVTHDTYVFHRMGGVPVVPPCKIPKPSGFRVVVTSDSIDLIIATGKHVIAQRSLEESSAANVTADTKHADVVAPLIAILEKLKALRATE